jgi:uncharacterized protein with HEPN domain
MTDKLRLYLHQMQVAASDVCDFTKGMDKAAFLENLIVQRAVGMSILMLGEAVVRLARDNPEFLVDHPEIPWQNILGLRNRIAHGYFNIDLNIVWETANTSLPNLLDQLQFLRNIHAQGE